jgi:DEAD/DEAH box helicase domain-containing protein
LGIVQHPDTGLPTIIIYDMAPGGVGISEAAFNKVAAMLCRAKQIMADCPYCSQHQESRGCPYCVTAQYGDEQTINRMVALEILQKLYA